MNIFLELFFTFAKIGLFTFGGGYAMLSLIENICVEKKRWISQDDMTDVTVIAESTPGPVAINCSTFVGYRQAGLPGAAVATFGMVLPSFLIIYGISMFFDNFLAFAPIAHAFMGIKIAVGILILDVGIKMVKKAEKSFFSAAILSCACAAMFCINIFSWNFSSITLILAAGAVGLAVSLAYGIKSRKGGGIH